MLVTSVIARVLLTEADSPRSPRSCVFSGCRAGARAASCQPGVLLRGAPWPEASRQLPPSRPSSWCGGAACARSLMAVTWVALVGSSLHSVGSSDPSRYLHSAPALQRGWGMLSAAKCVSWHPACPPTAQGTEWPCPQEPWNARPRAVRAAVRWALVPAAGRWSSENGLQLLPCHCSPRNAPGPRPQAASAA